MERRVPFATPLLKQFISVVSGGSSLFKVLARIYLYVPNLSGIIAINVNRTK
jgi:hypothetical protein